MTKTANNEPEFQVIIRDNDIVLLNQYGVDLSMHLKNAKLNSLIWNFIFGIAVTGLVLLISLLIGCAFSYFPNKALIFGGLLFGHFFLILFAFIFWDSAKSLYIQAHADINQAYGLLEKEIFAAKERLHQQQVAFKIIEIEYSTLKH